MRIVPSLPHIDGNEISGWFARSLGNLVLRFAGWRAEGALPPGSKGVVIAAPHTSNWDMPLMLAVSYVLGVRPSWLGKRELFRWPFGGFMRRLGGIAVDRGTPGNLVRQVVDAFGRVERMYVVIPPSATRSRATHWKSGFYHIALGAGVPIICTFLDYRRKVGGIGPTFVPSGHVRADMDIVRSFYETITGRHPQQTTPVRLLEEDEAPAARRASAGGA